MALHSLPSTKKSRNKSHEAHGTTLLLQSAAKLGPPPPLLGALVQEEPALTGGTGEKSWPGPARGPSGQGRLPALPAHLDGDLGKRGLHNGRARTREDSQGHRVSLHVGNERSQGDELFSKFTSYPIIQTSPRIL